MIVISSGSLSQYRVHRHFNEIAWDSIEQIRQLVHSTTPKHRQFGQISHHFSRLRQPEFERLKDDVNSLDKAIRIFHTAVLTHQNQEMAHFQDEKKILIEHLQGLQEKLASYREIPPLSDQNIIRVREEEPYQILVQDNTR